MAFDMYAEEKHEKIDHHEEYIFSFISESSASPNLNWLWNNFYNGPTISPEVANGLVHELIQLKAMVTTPTDHGLIDRLLIFLSFAHLNKISIRCVSD
ncbi:MAG: hypothetical protein F6K11_11625 [Leptolyngbya sp. SIO3F4]|nr:hypothetical protein [Leptolyngbya sp. SIO3F4]